MEPAGMLQVAAKNGGRWQCACGPSRGAGFPAEFVKALETNAEARAFAKTLNMANVYAVVFRLETAKNPRVQQPANHHQGRS